MLDKAHNSSLVEDGPWNLDLNPELQCDAHLFSRHHINLFLDRMVFTVGMGNHDWIVFK